MIDQCHWSAKYFYDDVVCSAVSPTWMWRHRAACMTCGYAPSWWTDPRSRDAECRWTTCRVWRRHFWRWLRCRRGRTVRRRLSSRRSLLGQPQPRSTDSKSTPPPSRRHRGDYAVGLSQRVPHYQNVVRPTSDSAATPMRSTWPAVHVVELDKQAYRSWYSRPCNADWCRPLLFNYFCC